MLFYMFLNIIHRATYAQRLTEHGVGIGRPWMFHRQSWSTGRIGASFPSYAYCSLETQANITCGAQRFRARNRNHIKSTNHMEFTWNFSDQISASNLSFHSFLESDVSTAWDRSWDFLAPAWRRLLQRRAQVGKSRLSMIR